MKSIKKFCLLFLALTVQLRADSISIQVTTQREYEVLHHFLKMGILEEGYGYVLAGNKPISIRNFYSLDCFPIAKDFKYTEREFANTLLAKEAIPIWKSLCASQKKFVIKAVSLNTPGSYELGWDVQFINVVKLQEVIEKNIDLFRYVLGPGLEAQKLVYKIAYSEELLGDILHDDRVLEGIVLGFGSHNSIVGGRIENINALAFSRDQAPWASKSLPMHHQKDFFGCYYLEAAMGEDHSIGFKSDFSYIKPGLGFSTLEEELLSIEAFNEDLPSCLLKENPKFIFGAYKKGVSNRAFFKNLEKSQKKAQALLKKDNFLEKVLEKIGGKKPRITCDKRSISSLDLSFFQGSINAELWNHILIKVGKSFGDHNQELAFIDSFLSPSTAEVPKMVGVSTTTLKGLKKALSNLISSNAYFENLAKDTSLQMIAFNQLYFKINCKGSEGKTLKGATRVKMSYVIEDLEENVLFASHNTWLSLSQTIPGFAHGVQGMHIGEKRQIFIHPSLAYGVLTTLPPCMALIVKVHLLEIDGNFSKPLQVLTSLDLSWIQNPKLYHTIEDSIEKKPRFIGLFYRSLVDKIEDSNKSVIIEKLKNKVQL